MLWLRNESFEKLSNLGMVMVVGGLEENTFLKIYYSCTLPRHCVEIKNK